MKQKLLNRLKNEMVLCIAFVLAVISMFAVPPNLGYLNYIDVRVLALLFCLMMVMSGLKQLGIFERIAHGLLSKAKNFRQLSLILVLLCFFTSMLITNDVALITFVPFTILLLKIAKLEQKMIGLLVLQTIAANLGSMLTPIGNPQNLYLYSISGMSLLTFMQMMLPLTAASFLLLLICCLMQQNTMIHSELSVASAKKIRAKEKLELFFLCLLLGISLLSVLRLIPYGIPLGVALLGAVILKKEWFRQIDYGLLLTFVCLFVFIGNIGKLSVVHVLLEKLLDGRVMLVSFSSSQFISNVPAAILLSGFTDQWTELLKGVNIGGLGTLIASLASVITYKYYVQESSSQKGNYIKQFTLFNFGFAVVLLFLGSISAI